jgi:hypothetical protein
MRKKRSMNLESVRKEIAKAVTELASIAVREPGALKDTRDRRARFWRRDYLQSELNYLRHIEASLIEQAWQTVPEPTPMDIRKA